MSRMTAFRRLASLFLLLWPLAAFAQNTELLRPEQAFRLSAARDADGAVILRWRIANGYYLYRDHFSARDAATGRAVVLETEPGILEVGDANFGPSEVYYGEAAARLEAAAVDQVFVAYQGCKKDSICYAPTTVTLDMASLRISDAAMSFASTPTAAASLSASPPPSLSLPAEAESFALAEDARGGGVVGSLLAGSGALWVLVSFLAFGLLLAFTPCVLPMYPILGAMLAREGETLTARRGFLLSSAYVLAMAAAFGALGIVAAWSGRNLQMVLQSPWAIGAVASLFLLLASSMFGLFELQLPSVWVNRMVGVKAGPRGSLGGALGMGFLSALIVGPCVTAPLAAALLYIAQTGDAALGAAALFALGLGQGLPLIAFGALGSRALPRAGAWMTQVKRLFGFVFLGAAIWMASRILPPQATLAAWSLLLLTAAVFLGLAEGLKPEASAAARFRASAGLGLALGGVILALGAASGGSDPLRPLAGFGAQRTRAPAIEASAAFVEARSTQELEQALASAQGRPSLVYVTADWCVICKRIERDVLSAPEIRAGLEGFQRVKADVTRLDPAGQALMRDLAVVGPPTLIVFDPLGAEPTGTRLIGDATIPKLQASLAAARR